MYLTIVWLKATAQLVLKIQIISKEAVSFHLTHELQITKFYFFKYYKWSQRQSRVMAHAQN